VNKTIDAVVDCAKRVNDNTGRLIDEVEKTLTKSPEKKLGKDCI